MIQLSNKRTKELEQSTTPIQNILQYDTPYMNELFKIQGWYHHHGLTTSHSQKEHVQKLSNLFGYKPNYYATYMYRYATWGFILQDVEFIFYRSKRGVSIQVNPQSSVTEVHDLLKELTNILHVKHVHTPYDSKHHH